MAEFSEEAMRRATGHGRDHWHQVLDGYGDGHTERVKRLLAEHPDVSHWWAQSLVVDFERARGLRVVGQTGAGDFQVSCSRTFPMEAEEAWERLVTTPFLGHTDWEPGTEADVGEARIEVRRAAPAKVLRWFWFDEDGKSTVEVHVVPKGDRCTLTFRHHQLVDEAAVERYRSRWKAALEMI